MADYFACAIDHGFVAVDSQGLVARSQIIECGSEVCAVKSADSRFAQRKILGSEVCVCDNRIIAHSSDLRFAKQNPRMVRIHTLHLTYPVLLSYNTYGSLPQ